jgi:hypothetical protein
MLDAGTIRADTVGFQRSIQINITGHQNVVVVAPTKAGNLKDNMKKEKFVIVVALLVMYLDMLTRTGKQGIYFAYIIQKESTTKLNAKELLIAISPQNIYQKG